MGLLLLIKLMVVTPLIRDHHEYIAIKDYIDNNIEKWEMDSL